MFNFTALPPLSLYIHVPWCVKKCPYCDFNSHKSPEALPEDDYINALIRDLEHVIPTIWGRTIQTIFIGGGTPSLFSAKAYEKLFSSLRALLPISHNAEITLEANPGTFEQQRFSDYRSLGINRLSIGIQSFNDQSLNALGRIHDSQQAIAAVETAQRVGFENINLDLMFGLPQQTAKMAQHDIETAISLQPSHLSYYQLTIEPNTLFYSQPPTLPKDDPIIDWQLDSQSKLAKAGYKQYEVSAYAKDNQQCRHNINYWQFGDYLGIGAGAHGKISDAAKQTITRQSKQKQPQAYLAQAGTDDMFLTNEILKGKDIGFEFMLNALRLTEGFPTPLFYQHTGWPISHIESALKQAEQQELISWDIKRIKPTEKGQQYLNNLIALFLPQ
jgi:oxygen-independent coproporphyrinogen-3 oxidase